MSYDVYEDPMLLEPDFSEAKDFTPVPPGEYPVRVTGVEWPVWPKDTDMETKRRPNGQPAHPMAVFNLEIINTPGLEGKPLTQFRCAGQGPNAGFLLGAVKALKPGFQKGDQINVAVDLTGLTAVAVVEDEIYKATPQDPGERRNTIRRLRPLA